MKKFLFNHKLLPGFVLLSFLVLNAWLFCPQYLVNAGSATFWPSTTLPAGALFGEFRLLIFRNNPDMFRIMGEWLVIFLIMLLLVSRRVKKPWVVIAMLGYLVIFIYQAYYAVSYKIYYEHPNMINDLVLMREVLPLFLAEIGIGNTFNYFLVGLTGFGLIFILFFIFHRVFKLISRLNNAQRWLTGFVIVVPFMILSGIANLMKGPDLVPYNWRTAQWTTPMIRKSLNPIDSLVISEEVIAHYEEYPKIKLKTQPDVYLLFFESYGAVAQVLKEEGPLYEDLMTNKNQDLLKNGWSVASAYSRAPIMGGRSWLSFTSVITGIHINNHITFNSLLSIQYAYPHMVRFFKKNGYQTYRLKTMANQAQSTNLSYSLADRFYAFDHWFKYEDIPYQGYQYDFFGGMPDQYALNYFAEELIEPSDEPLFFFMINMSSHGPWHHPPPLMENWKDLDTIKQDPDGSGRALDYADESMRYFNSIKYSMEVFVDYILNNVDENSIVILLGDHQPPGMSFICYRIIEEPAVPVHIISKNKSFIQSFGEYGFKEGMLLNLNDPVQVKHEGLYSMLIRELTRHYGKDRESLPVYLPNGL